jgi:hypothetical protein
MSMTHDIHPDEIEEALHRAYRSSLVNPNRDRLERLCRQYGRGLMTDEEFAAEVVEVVHTPPAWARTDQPMLDKPRTPAQLRVREALEQGKREFAAWEQSLLQRIDDALD